MKYVIEVNMPASGYAGRGTYFIGPFTTEDEAEYWGTKNCDSDDRVQGWEIHILNNRHLKKGEWLGNG